MGVWLPLGHFDSQEITPLSSLPQVQWSAEQVLTCRSRAPDTKGLLHFIFIFNGPLLRHQSQKTFCQLFNFLSRWGVKWEADHGVKSTSQFCLLFKKKTAIRLEKTEIVKTYSQKTSQKPVRSHGGVLKPALKNGGTIR